MNWIGMPDLNGAALCAQSSPFCFSAAINLPVCIAVVILAQKHGWLSLNSAHRTRRCVGSVAVQNGETAAQIFLRSKPKIDLFYIMQFHVNEISDSSHHHIDKGTGWTNRLTVPKCCGRRPAGPASPRPPLASRAAAAAAASTAAASFAEPMGPRALV